jgi:hypothetical protein
MENEVWNEKNLWVKRSDTFTVEIVHWTSEKHDYSEGTYKDTGEKNHYWNVYLYVYPKNKLFARLEKSNKMYDTELDHLFHGGVTYLDKQEKYIKIGSDYNHLYDDVYLMSSPYFNGKGFEPNRSVLTDADMLYDWAKEREK